MAINNLNIPGFSGLTGDASNLIKNLFTGTLTPGSRKAIYDAGAERGVASGMPGSTGYAGSLFANADLRNIGRAAEDQQQKGFQDLLAMITGYSGTVAPTVGQDIQQQQFSTTSDLERQNFELQKRLSLAQNARQQGEYQTRYGPKRQAFGTFKNGRFTTSLGSPLGGGISEGYDFLSDPTTGQVIKYNS